MIAARLTEGKACCGASDRIAERLDEVHGDLLVVVKDARRCGLIASAESADPAVRGRAGAFDTIVMAHWRRLLGARAVLEQLHRDLTGDPSPAWTRANATLQVERGPGPWSAGLQMYDGLLDRAAVTRMWEDAVAARVVPDDSHW